MKTPRVLVLSYWYVPMLSMGVGQSLKARWDLLEQGLPSLGQHWLLGCFINEVVEARRGGYIHNWLSFWLAFGFAAAIVPSNRARVRLCL